MLVIHVDYDKKAWMNNTVNDDASHERCTIIPADGTKLCEKIKDLTGDPYPGSTNNTSLTNSSSPAATLYNENKNGKKYMNKPIENIKEKNGVISFKFNGGGAPDAIEDLNISGDTFVEVYNTSGVLLQRTASSDWFNNMPHGIYIIKSGNSTRKIAK